MNRYYITVSSGPTTGHPNGQLQEFTVHAGTPEVAIQNVLKRRMGFPKVPFNRLFSIKFDIANHGKVVSIVEPVWYDTHFYPGVEYKSHNSYTTKYILATEPVPEGWEVFKRKNFGMHITREEGK
jgi:hypothetical protein